MRQTADSIRATIDDDEFFVLNSILVLKLKPDAPISYEAVLGVLNCALNNFVYRSLTQEEGRPFAEVKPKNVRKLLIPNIGHPKVFIGGAVGRRIPPAAATVKNFAAARTARGSGWPWVLMSCIQ
jgi:hypothetical protein